MKNQSFFKRISAGLLLGLALCISSLTGQGAVVTYSTEAATTNNLVATIGAIQYLTLSSTTNSSTGAVLHVTLFDAPGVTATNMVAKYTNYTPTLYTNVTYYTNIMDVWVGTSNGVVSTFLGPNALITNSYYFITNLASTIGGSTGVTNTYRRLGTWTLPPATTLSVPFTTPLTFFNGIMFSNDQPASISVQYQPYR